MRSDVVPVDQLLAHPYNPVIHPRPQTEAVKGSLKELGWIGHVFVNLRTSEAWGDDQGVETVFDGHDRIKAAMEAGETHVPVDYYDLEPEEEAKAILYLRQTAQMAVLDAEPLGFLLNSVETTDAALMNMLANMAEEGGVVVDDDGAFLVPYEYGEGDDFAAGDQFNTGVKIVATTDRETLNQVKADLFALFDAHAIAYKVNSA